MNAKIFLQQRRLYDTRINAKIEERQHLKDMVTRITTNLTGDAGGGNGNQDKLGTIVAKLVDIETDIDADVDRFVVARANINDVLNKITNGKQYEVLHRRYESYETWEHIADEMGMTYRGVCYLHGKALQTVSRIISEDHEQ